MSFPLIIVFSLTILIAGVIALLLFKRINKLFHPFIYYIWLGCINELVSIAVIIKGHQTIVKNNIYALIASFLLTWFFQKIGFFNNRKWLFILLLAFLLSAWIFENFIYGSMTTNSTYFRIIFAIIIVIMSLFVINRLIFSNTDLLKNSIFVLCISFVIFFSFRVILQSFVIYGSGRPSDFLLNLYSVMGYILLATNILHTIAILWMPKKARYTRLF